MYNYYSEELKTKTYETQLPLSPLLPIAYATIYDSFLLFILQNNNINAKRFSLYPMSMCVCVCIQKNVSGVVYRVGNRRGLK